MHSGCICYISLNIVSKGSEVKTLSMKCLFYFTHNLQIVFYKYIQFGRKNVLDDKNHEIAHYVYYS